MQVYNCKTQKLINVKPHKFTETEQKDIKSCFSLCDLIPEPEFMERIVKPKLPIYKELRKCSVFRPKQKPFNPVLK